MRFIRQLLLIAGLAPAAAPAAAQVIGFDDATAGHFAWLPNGYQGFNWSNAFAIDPTGYFLSTANAGGFNTVLSSGRLVLGNGAARPLEFWSDTAFSLRGGWFSAAWRNGLTLVARGYLNGAEIFTRAFTLDWASPRWVDLDFVNVDRVRFESSGGSWDTYVGRNASFAADDLTFGVSGPSALRTMPPETVAPEPVAMALVASGLAGLGGASVFRRRRQKPNA